MYRPSVTAVVALLACVTASGQAPSAPNAPNAPYAPDAPALSSDRLTLIEPLVTQATADRQLPGAVVVAGIGDRVVYRKAVGNRALRPSVEPMTLDTIFDLASLTKVVATTTAVMQLVEDGQLRLADRVSAYIPGFERYGKDRITIRHLLTHTSGLRPDLELEVPFEGKDEAIRRAVEEVPATPPGDRFIYSDINFFLLGAIVEHISGETLGAYTARRIFGPLGMRDTTFLPPASLRSSHRADGSVRARSRGRAAHRAPRCCEASSTIRPHGEWEGMPAMPASSRRERTCRSSCGCCWRVARGTACAFCRR